MDPTPTSRLLIGARVIASDRVLAPGWVRVDGRSIAAVGEGAAPTDVDLPIAELAGAWLLPGFVDLHVHGGDGASHPDGDPASSRRAVAFHRRHGTTTALASLVTAPLDKMIAAAAALAGLVDEGTLAGVHLEGPFLSAVRCGAQDPAHLREPEPAAVQQLLRAGRGTVRVVTLAPELRGGIDAVRAVVTAGVVAAIGHTDADHATTSGAVRAGARLATHLWNGMRPLHHRELGPIAALLAADEVVCELIVDGAHLDPATVAFSVRVAGSHRLALITDAIAAAGVGDGEVMLGSQPVRIRDGVATLVDGGALAGSTLTMDAAVRRTVRDCGVGLVDAARMAATTPAGVLGLGDRIGAIAVGLDADLVVLDDALDVQRVMHKGDWVADAASG